MPVSEKMNGMEDHKWGFSCAKCMVQYNLKKLILYHIIKAKEKIKEVMKKVDNDGQQYLVVQQSRIETAFLLQYDAY